MAELWMAGTAIFGDLRWEPDRAPFFSMSADRAVALGSMIVPKMGRFPWGRATLILLSLPLALRAAAIMAAKAQACDRKVDCRYGWPQPPAAGGYSIGWPTTWAKPPLDVPPLTKFVGRGSRGKENEEEKTEEKEGKKEEERRWRERKREKKKKEKERRGRREKERRKRERKGEEEGEKKKEKERKREGEFREKRRREKEEGKRKREERKEKEKEEKKRKEERKRERGEEKKREEEERERIEERESKF